MSAWNDRLSRSADGDRARLVTMAFVCVCARAHIASLQRRLEEKPEGWGEGQEREREGERQRGEKREANHSQLWHKVQVSCVPPGKQQCQELLGKLVGFFHGSAYKTAGPWSRYWLRLTPDRFCWSYNNLAGLLYREPLTKTFVSFIQLASDMRHFYRNCWVMLNGSSCSGRGRVLTPLTPRSGLCQT